jgi:hypothetical protein
MSSTGVADSNPLFQTIRLAVADSLRALAGGGQSQIPLDGSSSFHRVTTVASNNDSVTLPASQSGIIYIVANATGTNSLNVFPAKSEQINALGANAAFAVAAGRVAFFICATAGQLHSILTA